MYKTIEFWVGFVVGMLGGVASVYLVTRLFQLKMEVAVLILAAVLFGILLLGFRLWAYYALVYRREHPREKANAPY
ncbi:hypothetical protein FDZ71_17175 [bacterium]|nr:MAG: hypothetical protein FDZ71_17175 [bacterium]